MEYIYNYKIQNIEYTDNGEVSKAIINYFGTCNRTGKTPIRHKQKLEVTFNPVKNVDISNLEEATVKAWIDEQLTSEIINNIETNLKSKLDETINELNKKDNNLIKQGLPFIYTIDPSKEFEILINSLRAKRNQLLAETDWTQFADSPLTAEQKYSYAEYRTQLRDLTNGLTTVEDVNSVTWPTKPGA